MTACWISAAGQDGPLRRLARMVPSGEVVGIDVADEMLRRAEQTSSGIRNLRFIWGSAGKIPAEYNYFTKVLSVESFYYYADQGRTLDELRRVLDPAGELFILINLYRDNHCTLRWAEGLRGPVHVRSESEYVQLLKQYGFTAQSRRIPDRTPSPKEYSGKWFKNAEELREFKRIGALLLIGKKSGGIMEALRSRERGSIGSPGPTTPNVVAQRLLHHAVGIQSLQVMGRRVWTHYAITPPT